MANEAAPSFWLTLASSLGLGLFTAPYLFRVGGAVLCLTLTALAAATAVTTTLRITHLRRAPIAAKRLSQPLLESSTEKTQQAPRSLPDMIADFGQFGAAQECVRVAVNAVCHVYLTQMALYYLHYVCFFVSLLLPTSKAAYPVLLVIFTTVLTLWRKNSIETLQKVAALGAVSTVMLGAMVAGVSVASGRVDDALAEGGTMEKLVLLPGFVAFLFFQIPLMTVLTGKAGETKGQIYGIVAFSVILAAFGVFFSVCFPESPHMLKWVLTLPYYGVRRHSIYHYAVVCAFAALIVSSCLSSAHYYIETLTRSLSANRHVAMVALPVPVLLAAMLACQAVFFPGPIEDFLFLDPVAALVLILLIVLISYAYDCSAVEKSYFVYGVAGTAAVCAAVDLKSGVALAPFALMAPMLLLNQRTKL